jgi:hypothetical protein
MPWDGDRQKDYIQVDARIQAFYAKYPDGRLQSEIVEWVVDGRGEITTKSGKMDVLIGYVMVKAYAYRTPDDPLPGIGFSSMLLPGGTPYTRNSEVENAETSAWGRAIAAVGLEVRKGIATADEIRNKETDGERYEVRITSSNAETPEKGGHQKGISRPQVTDIISLSKRLDYNPTEMADVICGLADRPLLDMPEDEEEQKTAVKRLLVSLSAEEAGKIIQTLTSAAEADATPADKEMDDEEGLPDVPDTEKPTELEEALSMSLGLTPEDAGTSDEDKLGS